MAMGVGVGKAERAKGQVTQLKQGLVRIGLAAPHGFE
jgi:hypothetical protein